MEHKCKANSCGARVYRVDSGNWYVGGDAGDDHYIIKHCPYCGVLLEKSEKYDANVHAAAEFIVDALCRRVMHRLLDQAADSMLAEAKS